MISFDPDSPVPPYEQIRAQVAELVRTGRMPAGERLPTVRRLAADLGLAANTVARAYRELERDGLVATRGRNGTVVASAAAGSAEVSPSGAGAGAGTGTGTGAGGGAGGAAAAHDAAAAYARTARRLGLSEDRAVALVRAALAVAATPPPPTGRPRLS
jgi:DNA-binding transcriptional MocR family regulator